jgi:RNA ligase
MGGRNRIVVDYGNREELVLLACIKNSNGNELPYNNLVKDYSGFFEVVKKYDLKVTSFKELQKLEEENREGFVIRFNDGFRVKVKFAEYCRLHVIITNVSNLTIWEHLKNGYDFEALLDRVPDEFYDWLKRTVAALTREFNEIERLALKEFLVIYHVNSITDRKDFAAVALKSEHRAILFKLYDKRRYDEIIWKSIKPVYSKPFSKNFEECLENS